MGLLHKITALKKLDDGIYVTTITPNEIQQLGMPEKKSGEISILRTTNPDKSENEIEVSSDNITVLNLGSTERTLILVEGTNTGNHPIKVNGDRLYVEQLPSYLKEIGEILLSGVRRIHKGELHLHKSGRFVESPQNFWTVKIQPRDGSLAITVKGRSFKSAAGKIVIKDDRPSYSRFKIKNIDEVDEAVAIINEAGKQ